MRFKKKFRNATQIVLLLFFLFVGNRIKSTAIDHYIATTELNVRTGPGTGYSVTFTLNKGDEVELLSKENSWLKIEYLGKTGYAHFKFLEFSRINRTSIDTKSIALEEIANKILIGLYIALALYMIYFIYTKLRDKYSLERVTHAHRGTSSERDLVLKLLKCRILPKIFFMTCM